MPTQRRKNVNELNNWHSNFTKNSIWLLLRFVGTQDSEGFTEVQIEYVGLLYKQGTKW